LNTIAIIKYVEFFRTLANGQNQPASIKSKKDYKISGISHAVFSRDRIKQIDSGTNEMLK